MFKWFKKRKAEKKRKEALYNMLSAMEEEKERRSHLSGSGSIGKVSAISYTALCLADEKDAKNFKIGMRVTNHDRLGWATIVDVNEKTGVLTLNENWVEAIPGLLDGDYLFEVGDYLSKKEK